jgi:spore maturation protein CgeB
MPFNEYCVIKDDFSDLEEKIKYLINDDKYKEYAKSGYDSYNERHNPEKCFEYYYNKIIENCKK